MVDSLTGQDAVNVAKGFAGEVDLSRRDPDPHGRRCPRRRGASMRAVTGKPIKFAGTGEALDALEAFHPSRVAGRILGMGDVVALVERAAETVKIEDAEKLAAKMAKGKFDLDDLRMQISQMQRMGGLGALANMLPGMKGMKGAANVDDKALVRLEAMMCSMTAKERARPEIINAKRKIRVAKGSGTTVQEVNKLLKMHQEMANAMKRLKKLGGFGKLGGDVRAGRHGRGAGRRWRPAASCPAALPGLPGGSVAVQPAPGFDKFSKK